MTYPATDPDPHPLLGAIVFDLEKCLPKKPAVGIQKKDIDQIKEVYRRFDNQYSERPDYKLWRSAMIPHFAEAKPWLIAEAPSEWHDWAQFARLGSESDNQVVLWSTVSIACNMMLKAAHDLDRNDSAVTIWSFVERLCGRLRFELEPLSLCPASCGISAISFIQCYQYLHHKAAHRIEISVVVELMKDIKRWVEHVDPNWDPGFKLDLDTLRQERKGRGRLHPGHDIFEFGRLVSTLRNIWGSVADSICELDQTAEWLQFEAYQ